jgi:hypothetical protein
MPLLNICSAVHALICSKPSTCRMYSSSWCVR